METKTLLSGFAVDDTAATGSATYVIVDVLDDASENEATITNIFDGTFGTTSYITDPSGGRDKVFYGLQGLFDGAGRTVRDQLVTEIEKIIDDRADPDQQAWLQRTLRNLEDHHNSQKTALVMMYNYLYNKPDRISAYFSLISTGLSAGSYVLSAQPSTGALGAALGLLSIAFTASNPNGQGGNPGNNATLDDWFSQANTEVDSTYQTAKAAAEAKAATEIATMDLGDPGSWLSQLEAGIVPIFDDKFKYNAFLDVPDYSGSGGISGFDRAWVTVDLRDANGDGRKEYTAVTSALNEKYYQVLDEFVYDGPPVPTPKAIFCEMLKKWGSTLQPIALTPGHMVLKAEEFSVEYEWWPPKWTVVDDYFNSPGFDAYDIVEKLNSEKYFVDFDGVEWPYDAP